MQIAGLQKLTLLDYPGKVATTLFVASCDLRCPYCQNAEIWQSPLKTIPWERFLSFLRERKDFLDGICVTGGEPLLQPDLLMRLMEIRDMGFSIKLDTNGTHPEVLQKLLEFQLVDTVAMDIKNDWEGYPKTCGEEDISIEAIRTSADLLMRKAPDYEFRTTVTQRFHTESSFQHIAKWLSGAKRYALQPFAVSQYVPDRTLGTPSVTQMRRYQSILLETMRNVVIRAMD